MNPYIPFDPRKYRSHLLILISVGVFLASQVFGELREFGMNRSALLSGDYFVFILQILFYQFLHGDLLHIAFNSFFLYQLGPEVESRMRGNRFWLFFLGNTFFVAFALIFLTGPYVSTIGISGFCMALLSYLWIDLQTLRHPMANQLLVYLILNIGLGFVGNISLVGHAAGAVFGILWWYMRKKW